MDKRLDEISLRLSEYSSGKFDKRISLSNNYDEIDAVSNAINMLGEDLKAITISRDYFTGIFNSVFDMVFVLDMRGLITDANRSAEMQLNYEQGKLRGKSINSLDPGNGTLFKSLLKGLQQKESFTSSGIMLRTYDGVMKPVRLYSSFLKNKRQRKKLILVTATDISFEIKTQNLIVRAIIDTQEQERQRMAKDLHDTLTQQLTAIRLLVNTATDLTKNYHHKRMLQKSTNELTNIIADTRNICFNLMPTTLEKFGLITAVEQYCNQYILGERINFKISKNKSLPELSPELKIDVYRIVQEFITNAVKHGNANAIKMNFAATKNHLRIKLIDNGRGFYSNRPTKGMGLQNVRSRVKSHDGTVEVGSVINKGTTYSIIIPLKTKQHEYIGQKTKKDRQAPNRG